MLRLKLDNSTLKLTTDLFNFYKTIKTNFLAKATYSTDDKLALRELCRASLLNIENMKALLQLDLQKQDKTDLHHFLNNINEVLSLPLKTQSIVTAQEIIKTFHINPHTEGEQISKNLELALKIEDQIVILEKRIPIAIEILNLLTTHKK